MKLKKKKSSDDDAEETTLSVSRRRSLRLKVTGLVAGLSLGAGGLLAAVVYVVMVFVPSYSTPVDQIVSLQFGGGSGTTPRESGSTAPSPTSPAVAEAGDLPRFKAYQAEYLAYQEIVDRAESTKGNFANEEAWKRSDGALIEEVRGPIFSSSVTALTLDAARQGPGLLVEPPAGVTAEKSTDVISAAEMANPVYSDPFMLNSGKREELVVPVCDRATGLCAVSSSKCASSGSTTECPVLPSDLKPPFRYVSKEGLVQAGAMLRLDGTDRPHVVYYDAGDSDFLGTGVDVQDSESGKKDHAATPPAAADETLSGRTGSKEPIAFTSSQGLSDVNFSTPGEVARFLLPILAAAVLLITLIAVGLAWLISGRVLRPLEAVTQAAERVGGGDLSTRVKVSNARDEVGVLARVFNTMMARLDSSFAAHQRFAANASHELRTPLASTKTIIQVTLEDPEADSEELREVISRIDQVNERSIATVDALLELADIEQQQLELEPIDMNAALSETLRDREKEIRAMELEVEVEKVPENGPLLMADPVLLPRLIDNVIANAVKYNEPGGSIEVMVRPVTDEDGHWMLFRVCNSGSVVSAEDAERLTEPFFSPMGRQGRRGHGLGLAIVSSIVQVHQARLAIEPLPQGGLAISVLFPILGAQHLGL